MITSQVEELRIPAVLAVADGIAGLSYGEMASYLTLEILSDLYRNTPTKIHSLLRITQQKLSTHAMKFPKYYGMGTTIAGLYVHEDEINIFNVGDSRVYQIMDTGLIQHTIDHTLLNSMIRNGDISREESETAGDMYKMLESCMVAGEDGDDFEIHSITLPLKLSRFLICTDGVHDMLSNTHIHALIDDDLSQSLQRIYDAIMQEGAKDNFSIILVDILSPL
jgi:protein phosphatase